MKFVVEFRKFVREALLSRSGARLSEANMQLGGLTDNLMWSYEYCCPFPAITAQGTIRYVVELVSPPATTSRLGIPI